MRQSIQQITYKTIKYAYVRAELTPMESTYHLYIIKVNDILGSRRQEENKNFYIVLQVFLNGRDENKKRVLINSNSSVIFKSNAYRLFANNDSYKLLNIFIENSYNCKQIIDTYCIKGHDEKYNLSYGFLKQYDGYHSK